jgi:hypothetical protein
MFAASARAAPPHPLRLVPEQANLVLQIEQPRKLVETLTQMPAVREARTLPFVREQLESPAFQRFLNLVAYYENDLGMPWPKLLDKVAGGGITLAVKAGDDNSPLFAVVHGVDENLSRRFLQLAVNVLEQELAREESKDQLKMARYKNIDSWTVGDSFFLTQLGPDLVFTNKKEALQAAIDRHVDPSMKSLAKVAGPNDARRAVPENSLAWLWFDLDVARNAPNAKDMFAQPSDNVVQTVAIGGWLDVIRRSPFLAAALYQDHKAIRVTVRFPGGGLDGSPPQLALHRPPQDQTSAPPLLEPKGVMLSQCFWFDFKALWEQKGKLFNEKIAKEFEDGVKKASPFLPGTTLDKLFVQSGPYHRIVVAHQDAERGYKIKPAQTLPAAAYVGSMRDKQFGKSIEGVVRGVALLAGAQARLKLVEETHSGVKIIGYRFPEDGKLPNDPDNLRFNFSPCFAVVGNQWLIASTREFCHDLIGILQQEQERPAHPIAASPLRLRLYSSGGVELLKMFHDQVLGQIVLDQAVKPAEGKKQLEQIMAWLGRLGTIDAHSEYRPKEYRFDLEWNTGEKKR